MKKLRASYHKAKRDRAKQAKKQKTTVDEAKEIEYEKEYNNSLQQLDRTYEAILPSLNNTTWINNQHNHKISFYNETGCFSNASLLYSMNNVKPWYDGVLIMSEWSHDNTHGAQFNLLLSNTQMITLISYANITDQKK